MALEKYWDFAENDCRYFVASYKAGMVANMMGAMAQGICEKYMKHIISEYKEPLTLQEEHTKERALKTHSLHKLINYMEKEMDVSVDSNAKRSMKLIDGYYFSTRYPGEDSIELDKEDIEECALAVAQCRHAMLEILQELQHSEPEPTIEDDREL